VWADCDEAPDEEGDGSGRRLLIALLMFVGLGAVGLVLALGFGIVVPPVLWFAMIGLLIVGVVAGGEPGARRVRLGDGDGARPIGCCPGPGTLRSARQRKTEEAE